MSRLMWFRNDLRVYDNTALFHATNSGEFLTIAVFCLISIQWRQHDVAPCRVNFILENLKLLKIALEALNIPLIILNTETFSAIPKALSAVVQEMNITDIYFNNEYPLNEQRRDEKVEQLLSEQGCQVHRFDDEVMITPGKLLTKQNSFYTVFTPFKRALLLQMSTETITIFSIPKKQSLMPCLSTEIPIEVDGYKLLNLSSYWPPGEAFAQQKLKEFTENRIDYYKEKRDFPGVLGTSRLSPYLAIGTISIRQCLQAALFANDGEWAGGNENIACWINELIWREFYKHIVIGFPHICCRKPFKLATDNVAWRYDEIAYKRWCDGNTGFPIVDAAMRQLSQTGWMHNRLRMIVSMFLSKDLLIDWRWGERYFMQNLIDGDFTANNGGWQWSASTGTDSVPYFRVFNPQLQSERFDPEAKFIKRYVPELCDLPANLIHRLHDRKTNRPENLDYPWPMVDHSRVRQQVMAAFKSV